MTTWLRVAPAADIAPGDYASIEVDDAFVAVYNIDGEFFAIDDVCTHDGGPLSEGDLDGFAIACPRHGAKFDIRNGAALTMPATQPTEAYEVKVENGQVLVKVD